MLAICDTSNIPPEMLVEGFSFLKVFERCHSADIPGADSWLKLEHPQRCPESVVKTLTGVPGADSWLKAACEKTRLLGVVTLLMTSQALILG